MNKSTFALFAICFSLALATSSCDLSYDNPNSAGRGQVVSTVEGLKGLAIGMRRTYSVSVISPVIRASGLSAREFGVVVGFTNPQELELGGTALPAENGIIGAIWSNNYRVMEMAETIINSASIVPDEPTALSYAATGRLYKAMTIGNLAMFFESFPTSIDDSGAGAFVSRDAALAEAIDLLEDAHSSLGGATVPAAFLADVMGSSSFDLRATINAYRARYNLFIGSNADAVTSARRALSSNQTDGTYLYYETGNGNENPLYNETTLEPATYKPVDNFGIDPTEFVVDPADGRLAFYLELGDQIGESSRIPVDIMHGFYDEIAEPIPLYLLGEMYLIIAEAEARQQNVPAAVDALNDVLTKTNDQSGVNANLPEYSGPATQEALLQAIYYNRRIELFLTGMSLEDSRRFGRPQPPSPASFESFDRNRNFYPYPQTERDNNPNTPGDPAI